MSPILDALGLVVADIPRSVAFYGLLGIPHPKEMDGPHVESVLPNGLRLMWDSVELIRQIDPNWPTPVGQRMNLAFRCDTPAEVDAAHARIVAAGHQSATDPWDAFWGQRYAQVLDPDGNKVDLFASLGAQ
jgi:catechol 2,3-dioxygenase-like lactoylglutathione lyase family enzyme